jgi:transglutaminase-like putative cysteine protease
MRMLKKLLFCVVFVLGAANAFADSIAKSDPAERTFEFRYETVVPAVKAGEGPVDVFIPLAESDANQIILERKVISSLSGQVKRESNYGNSFWHASVEDTEGKDVSVVVQYKVLRKVHTVSTNAESKVAPLTEAEKERYLGANKRVPVSGDLIVKIQKDLPKGGDTPLERARIIYDYVVANMEYKKVGSGWGNGDTYWACSKKYGNCTDFHALFISLARAEGIPSRFEIGFPVPEDKAEGNIGGYHCWVTFFDPAVGWVPIDASEARKHPEKKDLLFGTQPADRLLFTRGRDLKLGDGHKSAALNYFVYPHVEISGKAVPKLDKKFAYADVKNKEHS